MADALIDIYDENMNPIGQALKSQAHAEGLWHKAFRCWIIKPGNNNSCKVWLQLRGKDKQLYPNLLSTSTAGHLQTGEQPKDGIRKIEEELGLKVDFNRLTKLFTNRKSMHTNGMIDNEFNPTYLCEIDTDISELKLQPEEVGGLFEFELEDLINLFNNKVEKIYSSGIVRNEDNTSSLQTGYFTRKEFIPHSKEYYMKVFTTIKRYCEGQRNFE